MKPTNLKWVIWQTILGSNPGPDGSKLLSLPRHALLRPTGNHQLAGNPPYSWIEVEYIDESLRSTVGWIYDGYLEDYSSDAGDVVPVDPSVRPAYPYGPAQEINFNGMVQSNLCAEFCAAYIGGDPIVDFLKKCQANPDLAFATRNKTSGVNDVLQLLAAVWGSPDSKIVALDDGLEDPVMGSQLTAQRVSKKLQTNRLVALVHIDSAGEIVYYDPRQSGSADMVLHWVVVEAVAPSGFNDGETTLYNPFPNKLEKITYRLLIQSMAPKQTGLWVPRQDNPPSMGSSNA